MNLTVLEGGDDGVLGHRAGINRFDALCGGDGDVGMHHRLLEMLERLPAGAAGKASVETHRRRILSEVSDGEFRILPDVVGEFRCVETNRLGFDLLNYKILVSLLLPFA